MDKYTGTRTAYLTLVKEDSELQSVNCHIEITIRENDISRLSAKLQGCRNQAVRRRLCHAVSHLCRACKSKLSEAFMLQHILAGLGSGAGNDINHTLRYDIFYQLHQLQYTQRCGRAGL